MPPIRILIADDDAFQRALVRIVVLYHFPAAIVTEAPDGQSTLAAYETDGTDAIITDIHMPIMDGVALTHTIRSRNSTIPIIVVSSASDSEAPARQAGASHYLAKATLLTHLPQVLTEVLAD